MSGMCARMCAYVCVCILYDAMLVADRRFGVYTRVCMRMELRKVTLTACGTDLWALATHTHTHTHIDGYAHINLVVKQGCIYAILGVHTHTQYPFEHICLLHVWYGHT
jgi:hypothetical protein